MLNLEDENCYCDLGKKKKTEMENQQSDPWGNAPPQITNDNEEKDAGFKDNFVIKNDNDKEQLEKLPDHEDYLNTLETKLNKLQKKSSIAKELAARRSDEARRMLDSNAVAGMFRYYKS